MQLRWKQKYSKQTQLITLWHLSKTIPKQLENFQHSSNQFTKQSLKIPELQKQLVYYKLQAFKTYVCVCIASIDTTYAA